MNPGLSYQPLQQQPASKRMRMSSNSSPIHQQVQQHQQTVQSVHRRFVGSRVNQQHQLVNNQETEEQEIDASSGINHERLVIVGGNESSDENNDELRSHIARLASELESLKTMMLGAGSASTIGSSSAIRTNKNNSTNFRLQ
jgi:hypothetical protein